jgi:hypothetical protein
VDCLVVTPEQDIVSLKWDYPRALVGSLKPQYFFHPKFISKKDCLDFIIAGSRFGSDQIIELGKPVVIFRHVE